MNDRNKILKSFKQSAVMLCVLLAHQFFNFAVHGESELPAEMQNIQIQEKLGDFVDIKNLRFKDEDGKDVVLANYFEASKPVVVIMAYYQCPGICGYLLTGASNSFRTLNWTIGDEYKVLTLSINPKEGPDLAAAKKMAYLDKYGRLGAEKGWHFLTGKEDQIQAIAGQLGFNYRYEKETGEYAHSAGIFILTPEGKISRVLYGIDFPNKDLKLSLLEASNGQVGTILDRFMMFCYRYDPLSKGYAVQASKLMKLGGILTILFIGVYLLMLFRRERKLTV